MCDVENKHNYCVCTRPLKRQSMHECSTLFAFTLLNILLSVNDCLMQQHTYKYKTYYSAKQESIVINKTNC